MAAATPGSKGEDVPAACLLTPKPRHARQMPQQLKSCGQSRPVPLTKGMIFLLDVYKVCLSMCWRPELMYSRRSCQLCAPFSAPPLAPTRIVSCISGQCLTRSHELNSLKLRCCGGQGCPVSCNEIQILLPEMELAIEQGGIMT